MFSGAVRTATGSDSGGRSGEGDRDRGLRARVGRRRLGRRAGRSRSSGAWRASGSATRSGALTDRRPVRATDAGDDRGARPSAEAARCTAALAQLAEQDPLIDVRQDDIRQELSVSLYGEVQKEVIQATLASEYGLDVGFRETTTICVERPTGVGHVELIGNRRTRSSRPSGFGSSRRRSAGGFVVPPRGRARLDAVRVLPGGRGHRLARRSAGLYGWRVDRLHGHDDALRLPARQSHSHASSTRACRARRRLPGPAPAGPGERCSARAPRSTSRFAASRSSCRRRRWAAVLAVLGRLGAVAQAPATGALEGDIPAARVHELHRQLPALTRGEDFLRDGASTATRLCPGRSCSARRPVPSPSGGEGPRRGARRPSMPLCLGTLALIVVLHQGRRPAGESEP